MDYRTRNSVKKLVSPLGNILGQNNLIKLTKQSNVFPFYHAISNNPSIHLKHLQISRTVSDFKKDLEYLLKYYEPISLQQVIKGEYNKPSFHLSFDDGLREVHEVVAPILIQKGIPCTFFLNSNFIDNKDLFFRFKASILFEKTKDKTLLNYTYNQTELLNKQAIELGVDFKDYLQKEKPYMTSDEVKQLLKQGFTVGAHSIDHPYFSSISYQEQKIQVSKSVEDISSKFDLDYKVFAFPFSDDGVSSKLFEELNTIQLFFGTSGLKNDCVKNSIQRISAEVDMSIQTNLYSEYMYYLVKRIFGKNTKTRVE